MNLGYTPICGRYTAEIYIVNPFIFDQIWEKSKAQFELYLMKLYQFSPKKPCYYCGAPPPSKREHAPPKMMFKDFACDQITVPSCVEHNNSKGKRDQAITIAMIRTAYQEWKRNPASSILTKNIIQAIEDLKPKFDQAKKMVELRDFLENPTPDLDMPHTYTSPEVNPRGWIRQLTAALIWCVTGKYDPEIHWDTAWVWSPGFVPISKPIQLEEAVLLFGKYRDIESLLKAFDWRHGWSQKPKSYPLDIFSFEVSFVKFPNEWGNAEIMFRHRFYNNTSVWYVGLTTSTETKTSLANLVNNSVYIQVTT